MNTDSIVMLVVGLMSTFLKNNPTAAEIEIVLPQLVSAFEAAVKGTAFSLSHNLSVGGKPGTFSASWTPSGVIGA